MSRTEEILTRICESGFEMSEVLFMRDAVLVKVVEAESRFNNHDAEIFLNRKENIGYEEALADIADKITEEWFSAVLLGKNEEPLTWFVEAFLRDYCGCLGIAPPNTESKKDYPITVTVRVEGAEVDVHCMASEKLLGRLKDPEELMSFALMSVCRNNTRHVGDLRLEVKS